MTAPIQTPLVMGESVRFQTQFTPHMILTHLKTTVTITDRRVMVHRPHQLFGVIPSGYLLEEAPLRHISNVTSGSATSTRRVLYGLSSLGMALFFFFSSYSELGRFVIVLGLIFLVIAVVCFATAHSNGVVFHSTGGGILAAHGARSETPQIQQTAVEIGRLIFS
ncbi:MULTISPECIES: hypothetical protein [unclassified Gordonia (in: high G+C Gram-positive bacteria)]|uniref:hypothetical protein n=1 Tax=unclassified Gordonia (in: high G+C Gram-positive bacteria) TaxID=2657482 RepID=UPI001F0EA16E|nr:hypothetical protein [Gordonia sp. ABSL49_1]MCH5643968.1 hypothetical protein [Gordonia sp. ABSL49_1]